MYLWLLYKHKDEIMARDTGHHDIIPAEESNSTSIIEGTNKEVNDSRSGSDHHKHDKRNVRSGNTNDSNDALSSGRFTTNPVVAVAAASTTTNSQHAHGRSNVEESVNVTNTADVKRAELSPSAASLEFLFTAYEPQYWYWEVLETVRRLLLTAVLSVCGQGTSEQYIYGIILAIVFVKLHSSYEPYDEDQAVCIYMCFSVCICVQLCFDSQSYPRYSSFLLIFFSLYFYSYLYSLYCLIYTQRTPLLKSASIRF